jgi:hypothetical protein
MSRNSWRIDKMSLTNLKKRIEYRGGARQVDRMIEDKE